MDHLDPTGGLAVFTDGSAYAKDRTGGWAYIIVDINGATWSNSGFRSNTTISQMELYAPTEGLWAIGEFYGPSDVLIYSDSEYVVLGSTDRRRKRNKNKDMWADLDSAVDLHSYVEWNHVYGHNGHIYNELADKLAGEARRKGE